MRYRARQAGDLWGLCALLLLAWALHWRTFGGEELGQDGYLSVDLGLGSLGGMLTSTARDVHPPLFFALLHALFALGGTGYLVAKVLPIAAAQLTLVVLFRLVRALAGTTAAWCATILLLLAVPFLLLSPTVRPFTLGLLCSLLTLLLTLRVPTMAGRHARREQIILALVTAAALLSWYLQLFMLALETLLLWRARRWVGDVAAPAKPAAVRRGGLVALAGGALLASPWYGFALPGLLTKMRQGATVTEGTPTLPTAAGVLAGLAQALMGRPGGLLTTVALSGGALALGLGIWCCSVDAGRRDQVRAPPGLRRLLLLAGLALGTLEVAIILARWQHPDAAGRYLLGLLPFVVTLQALALTARPPRLRRFAMLGVALALWGQLAWYSDLLAIPPNDYEHDSESAFLLAHLQPGDGLLFSDHGRRGQFLLNRHVGAVYPTAVVQTSGDRYLADTPAQAAQQVAALLPQAQRIWYVNTEERPGRPRLGQEALAARAFVTSQARAGDSDLSLFLTRQPEVHRNVNVTLGGAVTLLAAEFNAQGGPKGDLSVRLIWRDDRPLARPLSVFVHLDGADGRLLAQHDGIPAAGLRPTERWQPGEVIDDRHGLIVARDVPAGSYRLHAGIYQAGGDRLALPDGSNQVDIGTVRVGSGARPTPLLR